MEDMLVKLARQLLLLVLMIMLYVMALLVFVWRDILTMKPFVVSPLSKNDLDIISVIIQVITMQIFLKRMLFGYLVMWYQH